MTDFQTTRLSLTQPGSNAFAQNHTSLEVLTGRIEDLPDDLRLVVSQRDGLVSKLNATIERVTNKLKENLQIAVRSAYGDIVLSVELPSPETQKLPSVGAKVQLEIPTHILGNPDAPVTLRYEALARQETTVIRNTDTPIDVRVNASAALNIRGGALPDAPVRLTPIHTQEAVQYIAATPAPRDIPATLTQPLLTLVNSDTAQGSIAVRKALIEALPRYNRVELPQATPPAPLETPAQAQGNQLETLLPRQVYHAASPSPSDAFGSDPSKAPRIQDARILDIQPPRAIIATPNSTPNSAPAQPAPNTAQPQSAISIPVEIVAKTPQDFPVVRVITSPDLPAGLSSPPAPAVQQHFILQAPAPELPIGSHLEIIPQNPQIDTISIPQTPSLALSFTLPQWPVMEEIAQVLHTLSNASKPEIAATAQQAAQSFSAILPTPSTPAQMGAATLFFVAALRGGDLNAWLGEKTIELLRREGHGNLIARLGAETPALARAEGAGQDWRALTLPLYYDGEIYKAELHYKHEREDADDALSGGIKATRFIFDLKFNAVGKIQLDGYFKGGSKRLDLILRSEQRFSQIMHQEMRSLYATALRAAGVSGELSFQNDPRGWVAIEASRAASLGMDA